MPPIRAKKSNFTWKYINFWPAKKSDFTWKYQNFYLFLHTNSLNIQVVGSCLAINWHCILCLYKSIFLALEGGSIFLMKILEWGWSFFDKNFTGVSIFSSVKIPNLQHPPSVINTERSLSPRNLVLIEASWKWSCT